MHLEIPDCKRCCLCVPLRYGILIFGYLNLIFTLFIFSFEVWMDYGYPVTADTMTMYRGVGVYTQMWSIHLLYLLEVVFNVVLLIGAHTKQTRLLRVYYYYGIMTTIATCIIFLMVRYEDQYPNYYYDLLEYSLAFSAFALHVYLLMLIRTELQKLKYQQGQFSYVNHMSEVLEPPNFDNGRNPL